MSRDKRKHTITLRVDDRTPEEMAREAAWLSYKHTVLNPAARRMMAEPGYRPPRIFDTETGQELT